MPEKKLCHLIRHIRNPNNSKIRWYVYFMWKECDSLETTLCIIIIENKQRVRCFWRLMIHGLIYVKVEEAKNWRFIILNWIFCLNKLNMHAFHRIWNGKIAQTSVFAAHLVHRWLFFFLSFCFFFFVFIR